MYETDMELEEYIFFIDRERELIVLEDNERPLENYIITNEFVFSSPDDDFFLLIVLDQNFNIDNLVKDFDNNKDKIYEFLLSLKERNIEEDIYIEKINELEALFTETE
jgi:hypothetical protein